MHNFDIQIDSSQAEEMLERIGNQADHLESIIQRAGEEALRSVTGVPVDTGRLAASLRLRVENDQAQIVSDVEYAPFVFRGTRYVDARPPEIDYSAERFAEDIAREMFQ